MLMPSMVIIGSVPDALYALTVMDISANPPFRNEYTATVARFGYLGATARIWCNPLRTPRCFG
jgi:hypothetical protein